MKFSAVFALHLLLVVLFNGHELLAATTLRIKPQVWEVEHDFGDDDGVNPVENNWMGEEAKSEYDEKDNDNSGPYRDDGKDMGLCVEAHHCANRDGTGLIEPRKNRCTRPKVFCPLDDLEASYPTCGISRPNLIRDRIATPDFFSGKSSPGEWPWLAMVLERRGTEDEFYMCNAVLIDDLHVITVAHCFDKAQGLDIVIRLGEHVIDSESEPLAHVDIEADVIVMHPNYTSRNLHNDLAVISLKEKAPSTEHISPICIPNLIEARKLQIPSEKAKSHQCITTGWGLSSSSKKESKMSEVAKKVSLPLVENDRCEKLLRKTKLGRHFKLHNSFLCAGGLSGKDSCFGDGGSPLMCQQEDGTFTLVGLVSWGVGCGKENVPGVYTNVFQFVDFIEQCKLLIKQDYI